MMEKKRIAVSGEEIIAPKKEYPLRFWYMCPKGVCTIIDVDEHSRKVRLQQLCGKSTVSCVWLCEEPTYESV